MRIKIIHKKKTCCFLLNLLMTGSTFFRPVVFLNWINRYSYCAHSPNLVYQIEDPTSVGCGMVFWGRGDV